MVIIELFAVVGLAHVAFEVSTQRITSPLTTPVPATTEYVELFAPVMLLPFLVHWYAGEVPPFVGTAVYVTVTPLQTELPGLADMATEGTGAVETFITTAFELADGFPQLLPVTVMPTLKLLPLAMLLVV